MPRHAWVAPLASLAVIAFSGAAVAAESLEDLRFALSGGTTALDVRLRYENVDQDNALDNADAGTLRTRLGYTTRKWNSFDAGVEYEGVAALGAAHYDNNPAPTLGTPGISVVADPAGDELNQAWVRYSGLHKTTLQGGRQRLVFDNHRFIGNVGWRQNEQTYDGYSVSTTVLPLTTLSAAFLTNVNNIVFGDIRLHGQLLNVAVSVAPALKLTAYVYQLDFADAVPARQDTRTLGLRLAGAFPESGPVKYSYTVEYADQSDYRDAPASVSADYLLAELGIAHFDKISAKLGYEVLSGDGVYGFQTPLATLHAFQGWADVFLNTPATGVRDLNLTLGGRLAGVALLARWHDFKADRGGADYGSELDAQATYAVNTNLSLGAKYADYQADSFAVDTRKTWAWVEYKF
jgi:hypothetical protein